MKGDVKSDDKKTQYGYLKEDRWRHTFENESQKQMYNDRKKAYDRKYVKQQWKQRQIMVL